MAKRRANKFDIAISRNLRKFRLQRKITQAELGKALGVTFQQIQKYEKCTDRISTGKLWMASQFLNISIVNFYEDENVFEKNCEKFIGNSAEAKILFQSYNNIKYENRNDFVELCCSLAKRY